MGRVSVVIRPSTSDAHDCKIWQRAAYTCRRKVRVRLAGKCRKEGPRPWGVGAQRRKKSATFSHRNRVAPRHGQFITPRFYMRGAAAQARRCAAAVDNTIRRRHGAALRANRGSEVPRWTCVQAFVCACVRCRQSRIQKGPSLTCSLAREALQPVSLVSSIRSSKPVHPTPFKACLVSFPPAPYTPPPGYLSRLASMIVSTATKAQGTSITPVAQCAKQRHVGTYTYVIVRPRSTCRWPLRSQMRKSLACPKKRPKKPTQLSRPPPSGTVPFHRRGHGNAAGWCAHARGTVYKSGTCFSATHSQPHKVTFMYRHPPESIHSRPYPSFPTAPDSRRQLLSNFIHFTISPPAKSSPDHVARRPSVRPKHFPCTRSSLSIVHRVSLPAALPARRPLAPPSDKQITHWAQIGHDWPRNGYFAHRDAAPLCRLLLPGNTYPGLLVVLRPVVALGGRRRHGPGQREHARRHLAAHLCTQPPATQVELRRLLAHLRL